ncbi:hypothetical protein ColLi_10898 [Colletotrichum liriopes]|uniref:Uncharacterized protein n=1 Tax=Colletotrichum liriopes TaxID=708192 RepID=A0AA37LWM2_9PEZI|nr:hypothetical protein ColLi_10898 [Colletotrichum liriopes]
MARGGSSPRSNSIPSYPDGVNASLYLTFASQPRVALCTHCKQAIRTDGAVESHFRQAHHLTGLTLRAVVDLALAEAAANGGSLEDPHTCELPTDGSPPLEGLPVLDGYGCGSCGFRTTSRKLIKLHAQRGAHGLGRPAVAPTAARARSTGSSPGWGAVRIQTLSRNRYARYWIVRDPGTGDEGQAQQRSGGGGSGGGDGSDGDAFAQRLAERQDIMAAEDLQWERTVVASADVNQQSAWVREMKWAEHLDGHDLVDLYDAGAPPASEAARRAAWDDGYREEQRRLALLPESFRHEVGRCSLRLAKVPHETRRWLKSINPEKPEGRPFALEQEADTVRKYQAVWERYLCYCIRAYRLGRAEAQRGRGIRFTDEQWTALDAMAEALDAAGDATAVGSLGRPGGGGQPVIVRLTPVSG